MVRLCERLRLAVLLLRRLLLAVMTARNGTAAADLDLDLVPGLELELFPIPEKSSV